jgi:hypothetical protein
MAESRLSADYVSYRDAAAPILARHAGQDAVDAFGLQDVFAGEGGTVDLAPAYAFLEAQGQLAVTTPALGMLALAQCPLPAGEQPLGFGLAFGRGSLVAVPGFSDSTVVVVDRCGTGLVSLAGAADARPNPQPADDYVRIVDGSSAIARVLVPDDEFLAIRADLLARVRLGASAEMLGVSRRLLDDATAYAKTRRQFGSAIGDFQAVQHLLAWAATEVHQLTCLYDLAVQQSLREADPVMALTVKAMAGRVMNTVAQSAIQVTGAISFTWEYSLNKLHHRGLTLDQIAGSSADLIAEIGRSARTGGVVPALVEIADLGV